MLTVTHLFEFGDEMMGGDSGGMSADDQIEKDHTNDPVFSLNGDRMAQEKENLMNNAGHVGVYGGRYLPAGEYASFGLPNVNAPAGPGYDGSTETTSLGIRAAYPEYHQRTGNELVDNQPKYYPQSIAPALTGVLPAAHDAYQGAALRNAFKNVP